MSIHDTTSMFGTLSIDLIRISNLIMEVVDYQVVVPGTSYWLLVTGCENEEPVFCEALNTCRRIKKG